MADVDNTSDRNGTSFTNKEMWVRVDGKLDAIIAKQNHYDIELALLNERVTRVEADAISASVLDEKLAKALDERNKDVDGKFAVASEQLSSIQRKLAYATGTVVGASFLFNFAQRWLN